MFPTLLLGIRVVMLGFYYRPRKMPSVSAKSRVASTAAREREVHPGQSTFHGSEISPVVLLPAKLLAGESRTDQNA
jgi:hypothetical protein